MWPMLDWGWGLAFQMLLWWLLIAVGLLAVAVLVLNGFRHRPDGASRDERKAR